MVGSPDVPDFCTGCGTMNGDWMNLTTMRVENKPVTRVAIPHSITTNLIKRGDRHLINLRKQTDSVIIHANLNWPQQKKTGFPSLSSQRVDLDLGCMYELLDGSKDVIQPLGKRFGSKSVSPFIYLDKDDRSGYAEDGENIFVYKPKIVKRVLFYTYIYEGVSDFNFNSVDAKMFFKISNGEIVTLKLDNGTPYMRYCAAALFTNINGQFILQKEAKYFPSHLEITQYYRFGIQWGPAGEKDFQ